MTQDQHYRRILRERPATAHHEAGHVVIATIEGLRFQRVSIVEDTEGGLGRTVGAAHPVWTVPTEPSFAPKRAFKYYERFGRVAYAGGIAQAVYLGRSPRFVLTGEAAILHEVARPLLRSEREFRDWMRGLFRQSEALTQRAEVWRAVEALANRLLSELEINGRVATQIATQALKGQV
jgi:hypothetical protein